MPELFIINNFLNILIGLIAVVATALYLRESHQKNQLLKGDSKLLQDSLEKSYSVLHQAFKKSQAILGIAELEGIKMTTDTRVKTENFEANLEDQLKQTISSVERSLSGSISGISGGLSKTEKEAQQVLIKNSDKVIQELEKAQQDFNNFLVQLKTKSDLSQENTQQLVKSQVNQLFEKFEQNLSDFLIKTQQQSVMSIEAELKATRELIDTYKQQQLKLIDENIIAMLEKTLSIVLIKKLTLKDQLDLVYEALEKAKIQKFIV